jgi:phage-related protein
LKSGEIPVLIDKSSNIYNGYSQDAKPLISVYVYGGGSVKIGDYVVAIDGVDGVIYLDSDAQNAYNEDGNQNSKIYAEEFPVLKPGYSEVEFDGGVEKVEILPRWWEL